MPKSKHRRFITKKLQQKEKVYTQSTFEKLSSIGFTISRTLTSALTISLSANSLLAAPTLDSTIPNHTSNTTNMMLTNEKSEAPIDNLKDNNQHSNTDSNVLASRLFAGFSLLTLIVSLTSYHIYSIWNKHKKLNARNSKSDPAKDDTKVLLVEENRSNPKRILPQTTAQCVMYLAKSKSEPSFPSAKMSNDSQETNIKR